jgi:acrylyl-CoA reductase (NADPH)
MNALVLDDARGRVTSSVCDLPDTALPAGEVTVRIAYSSINYKDALAVTNRGKIVRAPYPFVPGIDFAGTVETSSDPRFSVGAGVIATGWGIGEDRWGGFSTRQRVDASMLVPQPNGMSLRQAMEAGTAGLTAMLAVMALERQGVRPEDGEVVVTGATGGLGGVSVRALAALGYTVVASTGKAAAGSYLQELGAARVIDRNELGQGPHRPLDTGRWAGAIDSVGGPTLSALLSQTARHGAVAACGLAGAADFSTTVYPFILRGVSLLGIDSNTCPFETRLAAWKRLAELPASPAMDRRIQVVGLAGIPAACEALLRGEVTGRFLVDVNA